MQCVGNCSSFARLAFVRWVLCAMQMCCNVRLAVRNFALNVQPLEGERNFVLGLPTTSRACLQGWNSLLVRPEPLLIKDIKVQVNKQKPGGVCPAQMKHNSDKMTIAPMSCQPCSKPNVSSGASGN